MGETADVQCSECKADFRLDEKSVDENRAIYGVPIFCVYCGKRVE